MTNMDVPLGACIGNSLEVEEAVDTLLGKGPADLTHECLMLSAASFNAGREGFFDGVFAAGEKCALKAEKH